MKKALFVLALATACAAIVSCNSYRTLQDYRRFVDYMQQTNEPFEVACETDYYTILMQEGRQ